MGLIFHALSMLCGLGAAAFATTGADDVTRPSRSRWVALAAAFGLMTWLVEGRSIDAAWTGGLVAGAATWQLVRPGRTIATTALAGALAALWAALLEAAGVPAALAVPVAAMVPILSAALSARSPAFAPSLLREEAMVFIVVLAVVVATAPAISRGWQSALVLNLKEGGSTALVPMWMFSFAGALMTLGGAWSLWRRG